MKKQKPTEIMEKLREKKKLEIIKKSATEKERKEFWWKSLSWETGMSLMLLINSEELERGTVKGWISLNIT